MLKSTYKPAPAAALNLPPLPRGWSEHTAPTGHKYYYNEETKQSTYTRPESQPLPQAQPQIPSLSDPNVANAYLAQFRQPPDHAGAGHGRRGGYEGRPKPQPTDKPRRKEAIPGHEPWVLVYTKYSRRFVYNPEKGTSYWRIPEKLMPGILELDKARIRDKAGDKVEKKQEEGKKSEKKAEAAAEASQSAKPDAQKEHDYDSSEYEEVEVTDDEGEDGADGPDAKRQRTEEQANEGPIEFTEEDIAMQLQAMGEDYGLDPGEYDDGNMEDWPEGAEGLDFSEEDAKFLFKDLLNDKNINPYSPWDKLMEDGIIIEDPRYLALSTTKARKECWDEWTREKIAELKEQRAKQEKKDPKIAYMAFLQEKATPKLYWPEFKRKYKKEEAMKDLKMTDKDREKAYRDHIARLKMPQGTLKSDLTALLKAQPLHLLNKSTSSLPPQVLTDLRYISLIPSVRDPLVSAYIQTLPPPPEDLEAAEEDEEAKKARETRRRRERALEERNRMVEEQQRRREKEVAASKRRLREGERELEDAMKVGRRGLQSQLRDMKVEESSMDTTEG